MKAYKTWLLSLITAIGTTLLILFILILVVLGGKTDAFYEKLNNGRHPSLIIGTSRASMGLKVSVFNKIDIPFDKPVHNFAYTRNISPYGPVYYDAIKRVIKPGTENGLFIVDVNPYSLSNTKTDSTEKEIFRENSWFLSDIKHFSRLPNLTYIFKHITYPYYLLFVRYVKKNDYLGHDDGWIEEFKSDKSQLSQEKSKEKKLEEFTEFMEEGYVLSQSRIDSLEEIIMLLKDHGTVYLTRLPISHEYRALEDSNYPGFSDLIYTIADKHNVIFLDYYSDPTKITYQTFDGEHLNRNYAELITHDILNEFYDYPDIYNEIAGETSTNSLYE